MSKFFWFPADHVRTALLQAIYSLICPFKRVITSFPICERCAGQEEEEKGKSRSLHARQFVIAVTARFPLRYPRTPIIIAVMLSQTYFQHLLSFYGTFTEQFWNARYKIQSANDG